MKRVYWKEVVKKEEQTRFLELIKERFGEIYKEAEEVCLKIKDKKGNKIEIYIPNKDFEEK